MKDPTTLVLSDRVFVKVKQNTEPKALGQGFGYWVREGKGILLLNAGAEIFAYVYRTALGSRGIVSAFKDSTGRTYFMYGMTEACRKFLGLGDGFSERGEAAESLLNQLNFRHWYADVRILADGIAAYLEEHPERWMPTGLCRLDDGSEYNPIYPLPSRRSVVCATLDCHLCLQSPQGDGRTRGWYVDREFKRRAGLGQDPLWQWEVAPGRTVTDVIALCRQVAADTSPDIALSLGWRRAELVSDKS